jgi:adenylate kinase family enzyme
MPPIIIFGPSATGKTLLAHRIVHANPIMRYIGVFEDRSIQNTENGPPIIPNWVLTCISLDHLPNEWKEGALLIPMVLYK